MNCRHRAVFEHGYVLGHRVREPAHQRRWLHQNGARSVQAGSIKTGAGDIAHPVCAMPAVVSFKQIEIPSVSLQLGFSICRRRGMDFAALVPIAFDLKGVDLITQIILARPVYGNLLLLRLKFARKIFRPDVVGLINRKT